MFEVARPVCLTSVGDVIARWTLPTAPSSWRWARSPIPTGFPTRSSREGWSRLRPVSWLRCWMGSPMALPQQTDPCPRACRGWRALSPGRAPAKGPLARGRHQEAFYRNAMEAVDSVLEGDAVLVSLLALLDQNGGAWRGPCVTLLERLAPFAPDGARRERSWPRNPQALSSRLLDGGARASQKGNPHRKNAGHKPAHHRHPVGAAMRQAILAVRVPPK